MPKNQLNKMSNTDQGEQMSESYISVGLGILVVVVVGILLYNFFTQKNTNNDTTKTEEKITDEATTSAQIGNTYTVKEGDTLWTIAESVYKNGNSWTDLAKANNLTGGEELKVRQQLVIPVLTSQASPVSIPDTTPAPEIPAESTPKSSSSTITESSYVVVNGDTLWDIACRSYGDCYAWPKIAQANKLINPDIIHAGNILVIPR